jgi:hypothetical protein
VPESDAYTLFAVITFALKLPLPSRATTVSALLAYVALTLQVIALDPLNGDPLRYAPAVC